MVQSDLRDPRGQLRLGDPVIQLRQLIQSDLQGLLHLAGHLSALQSDSGYRTRLYELVSGSVALAKWQRFGSLVSFKKDLSIAKEAAAHETPLNWADFMRCYLIERALSYLEISADAVRFLAACLQGAPADTRKVIDRMLEAASAIQSSGEKADVVQSTERSWRYSMHHVRIWVTREATGHSISVGSVRSRESCDKEERCCVLLGEFSFWRPQHCCGRFQRMANRPYLKQRRSMHCAAAGTS